MPIVGRSPRVPGTFVWKSSSELGDSDHSNCRMASNFARWAVGSAAFAALAACGQQATLTPLGSASAATAATKPAIDLQLTPSTVVNGHAATLKWNASNA